jgi:hypothetical protein
MMSGDRQACKNRSTVSIATAVQLAVQLAAQLAVQRSSR